MVAVNQLVLRLSFHLHILGVIIINQDHHAERVEVEPYSQVNQAAMKAPLSCQIILACDLFALSKSCIRIRKRIKEHHLIGFRLDQQFYMKLLYLLGKLTNTHNLWLWGDCASICFSFSLCFLLLCLWSEGRRISLLTCSTSFAMANCK